MQANGTGGNDTEGARVVALKAVLESFENVQVRLSRSVTACQVLDEMYIHASAPKASSARHHMCSKDVDHRRDSSQRKWLIQ
jgi:hypothetical protein